MDITHFSVPKFVNRKDEVTLECHFKMSSPHETLHSVKWYRIDHTGAMEDFFTFMPANNPPVKTYPRSGINVDVGGIIPILCSPFGLFYLFRLVNPTYAKSHSRKPDSPPREFTAAKSPPNYPPVLIPKSERIG